MQQINEQREMNIYMQYQNVIAPFIVELEVRDSEYPIEIFNEIRSIFTHLSRYKIQNSEKDITSAEKHVKRAMLDCFKYLCVSIAEKVSDFRKEYKHVDLHLADSGKFLPELDKLEAEAQKAYKKAKKAEIAMEEDDDEIYSLHETAYNAYSKLDKFLDDSREVILFASTQSKKEHRLTIVSCVVTVISIILALVALF